MFNRAPQVFNRATPVFDSAPPVFNSAPSVFSRAPSLFNMAPSVFTKASSKFVCSQNDQKNEQSLIQFHLGSLVPLHQSYKTNSTTDKDTVGLGTSHRHQVSVRQSIHYIRNYIRLTGSSSPDCCFSMTIHHLYTGINCVFSYQALSAG